MDDTEGNFYLINMIGILMSKLISNDDFVEIVKQSNPYVQVIGTYKGMSKKIKCRCLICGEEYEANAQDVKIGKKHRKCALLIANSKKLKTQDNFNDEMALVHPEIEVIGDYVGAQKHIECRCIIHNEIFSMTPTHLLAGKTGCRKCASEKTSSKLRKSEDVFIEQLHSINPNIIVVDGYTTTHNRVHVKCKDCGYEWDPIAGSLLSGTGCPHCVGRHKTTDEFINEISSLNNTIEIIGEYINSSTKIKCRCKICDYEWYAIPGNLKYSRCPHCNLSRGEKRILEYLKQNNINYTPQKKFPDLVGIKGGYLSYDYYLDDYNILIEYQGEFHDGTAHQQTREEYEIQVEHDKRKREYAKHNGFKMIEIWYWDYDNIYKILEREIR